MTANITGVAVYQGMVTALDTLCAQSFGSGRKDLVGLYFQRMVVLLWVLTLPIALLWWHAGTILTYLVPDKAIAELAGSYLRILILGLPGLVLFEAEKRFVQAQGIFHATTCVLAVLTPLHALVNWLLVWKLGFGFSGAALSMAITNNLLPSCLALFVLFVDGRECWNGFTLEAWADWLEILSLAVPGTLMLLTEYLAFEVLTLAASHFSVTQLAAQSIISPLVALTLQLPLAISIASSTRIANFIGAALPDRARMSALVRLSISPS